MQQQDPYRQDAPSATDRDLTALAEQGPVSASLGMQTNSDASQFTDSYLGGVKVDFREALQNSSAFGRHNLDAEGREIDTRLTADEANARFGGPGVPRFTDPISEVRAAEVARQAQLRMYRAETVSRANLSPLEAVGSSIVGTMTDPILLPTWFIGGGSAGVRALRQAPVTGRVATAFRGAAVGVIDGTLGGVGAEAITTTVRRHGGEDVDYGDSLRNILLGTGMGGLTGGLVGGLFHSSPRAAVDSDALRAAMRSQETGRNPARISADPDGAGPAGGGAVGALQLLPDTARRMADRLGVPFDARRLLNDVAYNTRLSDEYMRVLTNRYGGDSFLAVTAYHAGEGNVDGWLKRHGDPRTGAISREAWLSRIEANNPRSARYPREVFARMGLSVDEAPLGPTLEAMTPEVPAVTRPLTDDARVGAFAEALEAAADDAPLDLGPLLERTGLEALDEASAVPSIRGQWLEPDVAVTRTGAEIPVRFALVELGDLTTSHTDDLTATPHYPSALQPRDRGRAGSVAENFELERDLNPKLLMRDKAASAGAPIVSPGGLVESGNGRTIALRRSARTGTPAWARYQAELKAQGFDTTGFREPVLVRMRSEPLKGRERVAMSEALNRSQTEPYSPVEQAMTDARRMDAETVRMIEGDDPFAAANRPFQRAFQDRVAPGDKGALTDADGALNPAGQERVRAALVQAAYGDRALTAALFERADQTLKAVGDALAEAAPAWARMRAEAPRGMDATPHLVQAVHMLRHARASREATDEVLARMLAGTGLFEAHTVSPETEAFLRLMFRDRELTRPIGAERLAWALKTYAREAADAAEGPDLFGETANAETLASRVQNRLDAAEGPGRTGLSYAGGSEPQWSTREVEAAVLDLRPPEPVGAGAEGGDGAGGDVGGAARSGGPAGDVDARLKGGPGAPPTKDGAQAPRPGAATVQRMVENDPEMKALIADTEALARASGVEVPAWAANEDPETLAEAIRAAAFCLATESGA